MSRRPRQSTELLGHAEATTTQIYSRVSIAHLQRVHDMTVASSEKKPIDAAVVALEPAATDANLKVALQAESDDGA